MVIIQFSFGKLVHLYVYASKPIEISCNINQHLLSVYFHYFCMHSELCIYYSININMLRGLTLCKIILLKNAALLNYQNLNFQTLSCFLTYLSKIITFSTDIQMIRSRTHIKDMDVYYIPVKYHKYWIIFVLSKLNTKWTSF